MTEFLQTAQGIFTNILAFAFALGVIIAVHEWGHLVVAKLFDVRVTAFSLGFGPRLWGFRRGETDYRLSLVPLGGYVKLGGEQPDEITGDPREFLSKPRWQRVLVYLAGPAMNVVLAILLIAIVFMVGTTLPNLDVPPVVGGVAEGSSAAAAGIEPGDRIVRVGNDEVDTWDSASLYLMMAPERAVPLVLDREGRRIEAVVTPERIPGESIGDLAGIRPMLRPAVTGILEDSPAAAAGLRIGDELMAIDGLPVTGDRAFVDYVSARPGKEVELQVLRSGALVTETVVLADSRGRGLLGINLGTYQRYGFFQAFVHGTRYTWRLVEQTFAVLGKIFTRDVAAKDALAGPIEIAAYSGDAARVGFRYLLHLMGFISISIAIVNLLPIPILDGGQVLILLVEGTMRRDLSFRVKELVAQVGFVLIMLLMLTVIYFDLSKNLPGLMPG